MIGLIYSKRDLTASNAMASLFKKYDLEEDENHRCMLDKVSFIGIEEELIHYEKVDSEGFDILYMVSRHKSSAGIASFTTHATGNFTKDASLGGMPKQLSVSAPAEMLSVLKHMPNTIPEIQKTYEATHHGPLLNTPSLFVEVGGNDEITSRPYIIALLGDLAYDSIKDEDVGYEKIAIGIGGNHYPSKFYKKSMESNYAFGHIMSRHSFHNKDGTDNFDMIPLAIERSRLEVEVAILDWKGMNSNERTKVINTLNEFGLDYERV